MTTENFKVRWRHSEYLPEAHKKIQKRKMTICVISDKDDKLVSEGVAKLYFKDQHVRRIGLKESFKAAVSTIEDKNVRTELWNGFKDMSPKCLSC